MKGLTETIKTLLKSAKLVYDSGDFTSATILYFKCLFVIIDYIILKKIGKSPKDHSERFRIAKAEFPDLYLVLDKYFPVYRDTYSNTIEKERSIEIKENVEKIIKEYKIPVNN